MKHAITIIALMISTIGVAQDELVLGEVNALIWDVLERDLRDKSFSVVYNPKISKYYFKTDAWSSGSAWIRFSQKEIESMRTVIEKYQEWNNLLVENNALVEDNTVIENKIGSEVMLIPDGIYSCNVKWNNGDDWYSSDGFLEVCFVIFSQSTLRHQMLIGDCFDDGIYSKEEDEWGDPEDSYYMPTFYLDWQIAEELQQIISQDNIEAKIDAYHKEKANED